jgi:hypothetical protein
LSLPLNVNAGAAGFALNVTGTNTFSGTTIMSSSAPGSVLQLSKSGPGFALNLLGDTNFTGNNAFNGTTTLSKSGVGTTLQLTKTGGGPALVSSGDASFTGSSTFNGNVQINGAVNTTGTKNFRIPHPLDPSKELVHAAIEAPQPLNVYSGNVITDRRGFAVVRLPAYFDAINRDFRYQLTPIGRFAQAIVAREISANRFTIRTDKPNVKVSWQVTAVRDDQYLRTHPFKTERTKAN